MQTLKRAERYSCYRGVTTNQTVVGFHHVDWELCLEEGRTVFDWRTNKSVVYPSSIVKEGRMRNGINDSNHRGVWFYLHWSMPWSPSPMEIFVEIEVAESSIHKTSKWHQKYCAAVEPPGALSENTRVNAIHVSSLLLPPELIANWNRIACDFAIVLTRE